MSEDEEWHIQDKIPQEMLEQRLRKNGIRHSPQHVYNGVDSIAVIAPVGRECVLNLEDRCQLIGTQSFLN